MDSCYICNSKSTITQNKDNKNLTVICSICGKYVIERMAIGHSHLELWKVEVQSQLINSKKLCSIVCRGDNVGIIESEY